MIKLRATEEFTLGEFDKLKNITRIDETQKEHGRLYKGDEFECEERLAKYLINETPNPANRAVAELIEYKPEKEVKDIKIEKEEEPKPARKRTTKKNK